MITSTEPPSDNVRVSIFPNPTQDILIRDIKGNLIHSKKECKTINQQSFDISSFAQGFYFLEIIINPSESIVYKIQKIK